MIFKAITAKELEHIRDAPDTLLVDVREAFEHAHGNLGGINLPLSSFSEHMSELPKDKHIVLYCRSGARSGLAARGLLAAGYEHVSHLQGGMGEP